MPEAKVTSKGQVTIPIEVREALGLVDGIYTSWELRPDGVMVRPMRLKPFLTQDDVDEAVTSLASARPSDLATVDDVVADLRGKRNSGL